jgi:hypothetical protein
MMNVKVYHSVDKELWDTFVEDSKCNHFLFKRDYMDYHSERFVDNSLMFFDEKNKLISIFPANVDGSIMYSHQGLTFGGLIANTKLTTKYALDIFEALCRYCKENGIDKVVYKVTPYIYSNLPSDEHLYGLFRYNARLYRRDVSTAVMMDRKVPYKKMRNRNIKKAEKNNVQIFEVSDLNQYWSLLVSVLKNNHQAQPVHSIDEITYLKSKFPENIRCHIAKKDNEIVAGIVIFKTNRVAHCQYIAASYEGKKIGALDKLIDHVINNEYQVCKYFDFGISNENQGTYLNEGLIAQKEGFGARAVVHDFYELVIND